MNKAALKNNAAKLFARKLISPLLTLIVTSILFSTQLFSNQNALLSVNNQGNVGIGILNAKNKLQVAGDSALGGSTGKVTYVSQFGSRGTGNGEFKRIYGIATHPNGNIYVTDMEADRVQIFDANYKFKSAFGTRGTGNGQFITPTGIVVHPNGDVYVVDTMNKRVQIFDASGRFKGIGPITSLQAPHGIAIHPNGDIYITDHGSDSPFVAVFNANHAFKAKFGIKGRENGYFIRPHGIAIRPNGDIYVADVGNNKVHVFDPHYRFDHILRAMGQDNIAFNEPIGITIDQSQYIYVTDKRNHRVQAFDASDQFRSAFSATDNNPGQLNLPDGIAVGPNGDLYVAEEERSRVQVFSPVPVFAINNDHIGIHTKGLVVQTENLGTRIATAKGLFIQNENNSTHIYARELVLQADYSASADAQQFIIRGQKNPNNQLELGYHTTNNYGSIQAITQNETVRPLILNPAGGNVGVGMTAPQSILHVQGDALTVQGNSQKPAIINLKDGINPQRPWVITGTVENFQVGRSWSEPRLTITDNSVIIPQLTYGDPGSWDWVIQDKTTGRLYLRSGSSLRYKKDVEAYQDDFSKLLTAQPKAFTWKDSGARDYGYIAEEFHKLGLTNLVKYDDKGRPDGIHYDKLPIYILELVKTLKTEKDAEILALREENKAMKQALCRKLSDLEFCH